MTSSLFKAPENFSFRAADWEGWIAQYRRYSRLMEYTTKSQTVQCDSLIYHMGTQSAESIMKTFKWGKIRYPNPEYDPDNPADRPATLERDESAQIYSDLEGKFQAYYVPSVNVINESTVFNKRVQGENESIDSFIVDLEKLVLTCSYDDPDRMVRDRFVAGLKNENLQRKLQFMSDLTLSRAVDFARRHEMVCSQIDDQRKKEANAVINTSQRGRGSHSRGRNRGRGRGNYNRNSGHQQSSSSTGHQQPPASSSLSCTNCG